MNETIATAVLALICFGIPVLLGAHLLGVVARKSRREEALRKAQGLPEPISAVEGLKLMGHMALSLLWLAGVGLGLWFVFDLINGLSVKDLVFFIAIFLVWKEWKQSRQRSLHVSMPQPPVPQVSSPQTLQEPIQSAPIVPPARSEPSAPVSVPAPVSLPQSDRVVIEAPKSAPEQPPKVEQDPEAIRRAQDAAWAAWEAKDHQRREPRLPLGVTITAGGVVLLLMVLAFAH